MGACALNAGYNNTKYQSMKARSDDLLSPGVYSTHALIWKHISSLENVKNELSNISICFCRKVGNKDIVQPSKRRESVLSSQKDLRRAREKTYTAGVDGDWWGGAWKKIE